MFDPTEYTTLAALGVRGGNPDAVVAMCDQRSPQWFGLRAGIPTASNAALFVSSTGKAGDSQTRVSYLHGLVAERLTHTWEMGHTSAAMERGARLEPEARDWYARQTGRVPRETGFVFRNGDRDCGCSLDGLCEDRVVEIKCPMRRQMIASLLRGSIPNCYRSQIQMQLWVTGLSRADFVLYTPEPQIPSVVWTMERDPNMMVAFDEAIPRAVAQIEEWTARLQDMNDATL